MATANYSPIVTPRVTITFDVLNIERLLHLPGGEVYDLVERTTKLARLFCVQETPVLTGAMRSLYDDHIEVDPHTREGVVGIVDNFDEAALWVQLGTGIYAGRGPIRPRQARFLRFHGKRDGKLLYLRQVAGQEANPFMYRGLVRAATTGTQKWTVRARRGLKTT